MSLFQKKKFFLLTLQLFLFVVAGTPHVEAAEYPQLETSKECPVPPAGKKYAIFGRTSSRDYPPSFSAEEEFCVPVNYGSETVSAQALMSVGVIRGAWLTKKLYSQSYVCNGTQFGGDNLGDRQVSDASLSLVNMVDKRCVNLQGQPSQKVPFRYRIAVMEPDLPSVYIYYIRMSDRSSNFNVVCSEKTDPVSCDSPNCFWNPTRTSCEAKTDRTLCPKLPRSLCGTPEGSPACAWNDASNRCLTKLEEDYASLNRKPGDSQSQIPACAFEGTCNDVNDLLQLAINYTKYLFTIMGTLAFVFFVYGGATMAFSLGSSDKVQKGKDILVAAVIGMIIAMSAYIAVDFILDILKVENEFRIIGQK